MRRSRFSGASCGEKGSGRRTGAHFYQQATDRGLPVVRIAAHVLAVNIALAGLAGATLVWRSVPAQLAALAAGGVLVALVLARFAAPGGRRLPA